MVSVKNIPVKRAVARVAANREVRINKNNFKGNQKFFLDAQNLGLDVSLYQGGWAWSFKESW